MLCALQIHVLLTLLSYTGTPTAHNALTSNYLFICTNFLRYSDTVQNGQLVTLAEWDLGPGLAVQEQTRTDSSP